MTFNFEEGSGFSAFALYNGLRLHFTTDSYDFLKYNGKTNVTKLSFERNKAKYSFYKLSRKYNIQDLRDFYISNFLENDVKWVGEIAGLEGEETFKKWQKRNQSLTYLFEQDIINLLNKCNAPDDLLKVSDGQYPVLLEELMQGNCSIETITILDNMMNFIPMWTKNISDDVVWPQIRRRIVKYAPFMNYDESKFKTILKERLKDYE